MPNENLSLHSQVPETTPSSQADVVKQVDEIPFISDLLAEEHNLIIPKKLYYALLTISTPDSYSAEYQVFYQVIINTEPTIAVKVFQEQHRARKNNQDLPAGFLVDPALTPKSHGLEQYLLLSKSLASQKNLNEDQLKRLLRSLQLKPSDQVVLSLIRAHDIETNALARSVQKVQAVLGISRRRRYQPFAGE